MSFLKLPAPARARSALAGLLDESRRTWPQVSNRVVSLRPRSYTSTLLRSLAALNCVTGVLAANGAAMASIFTESSVR